MDIFNLFLIKIFLFELQKYRENSFYVTSFFNEEKKLGSFLAKMFPLFIFSIFLFRDKFKNIKIEKIVHFVLCIFLLIILTTERVAYFS